ncbi:MAG: MATE family efflux transporter, partial [Muribaculaceae bacterium]|nr:MATE family efflux transporter [Muribaculaceae bacterium]
FLGSRWLVEMFIPVTTTAGQLAVKRLPIFSICAVFFALNIAYIGFYQSVGNAMKAIIFTLLRGVILLVPLFFILSSLFPEWGMWAAIPAAEMLTFVIILMTRGKLAKKSASMVA